MKDLNDDDFIIEAGEKDDGLNTDDCVRMRFTDGSTDPLADQLLARPELPPPPR